MTGAGLLALAAPSASAGQLGTFLQYAIVGCGYAGLVLSLLGALGLLHKRLTDPVLKDFTAPADIFNLAFFLVAFGMALGHAVLVDADFTRSTAFVRGLISFDTAAIAGGELETGLLTGTVVLMGLLVAYIPLTHMSHFIGKYFAYHAIRWNDEPNLRGGDQEAGIQQVLSYPVSWAAPHIQGGGTKTWADLATEEMKK
jgi:nitrate reductase gamma subunit